MGIDIPWLPHLGVWTQGVYEVVLVCMAIMALMGGAALGMRCYRSLLELVVWLKGV